MNRSMVRSWIAIIPCLFAVSTLPQAGNVPACSRIEIRVDVSANNDSGPGEPCEAVQVSAGKPVAFWSTFGEVEAGEAGEAFKIVSAANRCGGGELAGISLPPIPGDSKPPFLILETSASTKWDPGPMDPGPVPVVQVILTFTSRQLTGFSPDGKPLYSDAARDNRSVRLGEGEEFDLPVSLPMTAGWGTLGTHEVILRIHARPVGRSGAIEYGALAVMSAEPGSDIIIDGGVAGQTGGDGSALLPDIPEGRHEIQLQRAAKQSVLRFVTIVEGRTVLISADDEPEIAQGHLLFTAAGVNLQGFREYVRQRDSAVMVEIPEGEFLMGNLETERKPQPHKVYVSSFLMDKLPVTWGQFKRFSAATRRPLPPEPYWGIHDDHPVAFVRWDEGQAYCEWAGGRLPTEAEREKAARGTDGRKFPWGNEEPTPDRGVFRRNWGDEGTDKVGIRPAGASPYGLLDTGGNMWEWCQDWYDPDYYESSPHDNPMGPKTGRARVVRGGSWDSRPDVLSASCRNWGYVGYREGDFGFRCAADPPR